jgi:hypothetical protein
MQSDRKGAIGLTWTVVEIFFQTVIFLTSTEIRAGMGPFWHGTNFFPNIQDIFDKENSEVVRNDHFIVTALFSFVEK